MIWLEYLAIAVKALAAHRVRSLLTISSITIGTFTIVFMTSLAVGGLDTLARGIEELGGARIVLVSPRDPERAAAKKGSYPQGLTSADRDRIIAALPHVESHAMYAAMGERDAMADEGHVARADLIGGDAYFLDAYHMNVAQGRTFTDEETRTRAKVCLVGHEVAQNLWGGAAVGHKVTIGGLTCRVIGQLAPVERLGIDFGFAWQNLLVAPRELVADIEPGARRAAVLLVKTDAPQANDAVKRIINAILVDRHRLDDFSLFDFSGIMEQFNTIFLIMEMVVGLIAGVALVVGGVGVMNMMLVSVSERVREIGIRKALGATPGDIGTQFLCEALMLSTIGGLCGAGFGALATLGAAQVIRGSLKTWVGEVSVTAVVTALGVSIGIGAIFGFLPARRASRLPAVEAMRR